MKFNKIALASAMVFAITSGAAFAAKDQGQGKITFTGSIIDAPCSISSDSEDQTVKLGQISNKALENGGVSTTQPFEIKLVNCDVGTIKTVTTTFTGGAGALPGSLGITGSASGASIMLMSQQTDSEGSSAIELGKPTAAQAISNGDTTLNFAAYLQGNGASATIVPGEFSAVANFALAYQ